MVKNSRVGLWTTIREEGDRWLCVCDCGSTRLVLTKNLKEGRSKSCGCMRNAAHNRSMAKHFAPSGVTPFTNPQEVSHGFC